MPLDFPGELIIDNFAGGGGTSEGLEQAFGRPVDIAINHDPEALAMHALNHPHTTHLCESVWTVNPVKVTRNQPVALVWLSPDCKHFSKAKGGTPVAKQIRGLAWVGMRWAALTKPRVIMLENVEEFQEWGPLIVDADGNARPDPAKKGKTFDSFVRQLRGHGYHVDWRELRACDQGAPTIRKRLFMVARRDGLPITWPEQSHAEPSNRAVLAGKLKPFRTAAECIDFNLPANSIFDRKKDLAENTQRRVAKGLWRHVLTSPKPFIVGVGGRMGQSPARGVDQPAQTITAKADSDASPFVPVLAPVRGGPVAPAERPDRRRRRAAAHAMRPGQGRALHARGAHADAAARHERGPHERPRHRGAAVHRLGWRDAPRPDRGAHHEVPHRQRRQRHGRAHAHGDRQQLHQAPGRQRAAGRGGANLITIGYGEKPGQPARAQDIQAPLGTVVAANKHAVGPPRGHGPRRRRGRHEAIQPRGARH
jgi:DNA (cytosine-5)-methyltransferase 1